MKALTTAFALAALCTVSLVSGEQIDYQPQIDNYQNLFACSYLAKYMLDS